MGNLWLKIKLWTKGIVSGVLFLYAAFFIVHNLQNQAKVWLGFYYEEEHSTLAVVIFAFLVGVITTILVRAIGTALRQMREIRERALREKFQREHEQKLARAEALNPRPADQPANHAGDHSGDATPET